MRISVAHTAASALYIKLTNHWNVHKINHDVIIAAVAA